MKKILILLSLIFLTGCSSIKIETNDFKEEIDSNFSHMVEISPQELKDKYKIDVSKFKQYIFKISYDDPINLYVFVLPTSKKDAKKEIDKFFDKLLIETSKENKTRLADKYYDNIDDYLVYIVSNNSKEIFNKLENNFKEKQKESLN